MLKGRREFSFPIVREDVSRQDSIDRGGEKRRRPSPTAEADTPGVTFKRIVSSGAPLFDEPPILTERYANSPKETVTLHTLRVMMAALNAWTSALQVPLNLEFDCPRVRGESMVTVPLQESDLEFRGVRA